VHLNLQSQPYSFVIVDKSLSVSDSDTDGDGIVDERLIAGPDISIVLQGIKSNRKAESINVLRRIGSVNYRAKLSWNKRSDSYELSEWSSIPVVDRFFGFEAEAIAKSTACNEDRAISKAIPSPDFLTELQRLAGQQNENLKTLVEQQCRADFPQVSTSLNDLLVVDQTKPLKNVACLNELITKHPKNSEKRIIAINLFKKLLLRLSSQEPLVTCETPQVPSRCGRVAGDTGLVVLNRNCLADLKPSQPVNQLIFHELMHVGAKESQEFDLPFDLKTEEKIVNSIVECCTQGFDLIISSCRSNRYSTVAKETIDRSQDAMALKDGVPMEQVPANMPPPQSIATYQPEAGKPATLKMGAVTAYIQPTLTKVQKETLEGSTKLAYELGRSVDRIATLVPTAMAAATRQVEEGSRGQRAPASVSKSLSEGRVAQASVTIPPALFSKISLNLDGTIKGTAAAALKLVNGEDTGGESGSSGSRPTGARGREMGDGSKARGIASIQNTKARGSVSGAEVAQGASASAGQAGGFGRSAGVQGSVGSDNGGSDVRERSKPSVSPAAAALFKELQEAPDKIALLRKSVFQRKLAREKVQIKDNNEPFGEIAAPKVQLPLKYVLETQW
jgi:hypothetical protein